MNCFSSSDVQQRIGTEDEPLRQSQSKEDGLLRGDIGSVDLEVLHRTELTCS